MILGLAACGDKTKVAVVSDTPVVKVPAAPAVEAPIDADKDLASRIRRAFEDAKLHGIDVAAKEGTVTLWGATPNAAEQAHAARIAAAAAGVKAVENRLVVVAGS